VPFWAKDLKVGFANINAKAEEIENRPAFREAFQRRRCLVPVVSFYERMARPVCKLFVIRSEQSASAYPA
jgi:putative SOS response-associated peptidase YedK